MKERLRIVLQGVYSLLVWFMNRHSKANLSVQTGSLSGKVKLHRRFNSLPGYLWKNGSRQNKTSSRRKSWPQIFVSFVTVNKKQPSISAFAALSLHHSGRKWGSRLLLTRCRSSLNFRSPTVCRQSISKFSSYSASRDCGIIVMMSISLPRLVAKCLEDAAHWAERLKIDDRIVVSVWKEIISSSLRISSPM